MSWAFPPVASAKPHILSQGEVLTSIKNTTEPLRPTVEASIPTGMVLGGLWEVNRVGPLDGISVPTSTLSAL